MINVTWFFRGSGSPGGLQSSTVPSTSRSWVELTISDSEDPPVSSTMFRESSEKIVHFLRFEYNALTILKACVIFIGEVVLKNVSTCVHSSILKDCPFNPFNKHRNICVCVMSFNLENIVITCYSEYVDVGDFFQFVESDGSYF